MKLKSRSYYIWRCIKGVKYIRYSLQMFPIMLAYIFLKGTKKNILKQDIDAFYNVEYQINKLSYITAFYRLMVEYPAFRNVFYYRLSYLGDMMCWLMPKLKSLEICSSYIGPGLYVQHGTSTQIRAARIGSNLFINQNVTIGWNGPGWPEIGDNVRIGTGAVVIGPIKVGNNVNIGANATVTKDIPSDVTVVSPHAYICKKNGKRTFEAISGSIYDQFK